MAECKSYIVESMYPMLCSVLYLTIFTANVPNLTRTMIVFAWLSGLSMKQSWISGCCTIVCTRLELSGRWGATFQPYTQASWIHILFHNDICLNHHNRLLCKKNEPKFSIRSQTTALYTVKILHSVEFYTQFCCRQLLSQIYALWSVKFLCLKLRFF